MAYIVEFTVSGLAGREETYSRQLNRDVNLFFGFNGSGKTSLLKILHSALSNDSSILRLVPFKHAEVKIFSVYLNTVITRTIEQTPTPTETDEEVATAVDERSLAVQLEALTSQEKATWRTSPKPSPDFRGGLAHRYLPTSRLYLGALRRGTGVDAYLRGIGMASEEELDKYFASSLTQLWTAYSADLLGAVRKAQEDGLASILKAVLTPGTPVEGEADLDPKVAYQRVASFLQRQGSAGSLRSAQQFIDRYTSDKQLRSVVGDIDKVERRIEEATAPREKLQSLIQTMFSGGKTVRFEDQAIKVESRHKEAIGLAVLSSGEKHILRLFVETLLAQDNIIIIDEPEISMHIDWQRKLIASMQQLNPLAQLILATHSPEIMADVDDSKIFRL